MVWQYFPILYLQACVNVLYGTSLEGWDVHLGHLRHPGAVAKPRILGNLQWSCHLSLWHGLEYGWDKAIQCPYQKNRLLAINKGLWHLRLLGMVLAIPINLSDPISTGLPARPYFESARYWSPGRRSSRYSFVREVLNQRKDCGFGRVEVCSDSSG